MFSSFVTTFAITNNCSKHFNHFTNFILWTKPKWSNSFTLKIQEKCHFNIMLQFYLLENKFIRTEIVCGNLNKADNRYGIRILINWDGFALIWSCVEDYSLTQMLNYKLNGLNDRENFTVSRVWSVSMGICRLTRLNLASGNGGR